MTKKEYLKLLVDTSAAGKFPAGDDEACLYRDDQGRRCAIGVALPDDHPLCVNRNSQPVGRVWDHVREYLPPDLTRVEAWMIQSAHDRQTRKVSDGMNWDHDKFVKDVTAILGE